MDAEEKSASEKAPELIYFEFLASLGLTKHIGSMKATKELIELCHVGDGKLILDVGCGVGATPCYLAKTTNCRVVGVDLLDSMIEQSRERARAEGVADRVEFKTGDARDLPFEDDTFDVVFVESVNTFFKDKDQAIREYVRVTKPGGYVGLTEMTWLEPPSEKMVEYYLRTVYADSLQVHEWKALMEEAGLKEVVANGYPIDIPAEAKGRFERYGCRGALKVLVKTLVVYFKEPDSRAFLKDITATLPKDFMEGMGYGVYSGRKP